MRWKKRIKNEEDDDYGGGVINVLGVSEPILPPARAEALVDAFRFSFFYRNPLFIYICVSALH